MSQSDPLSDMLTRVRNAQMALHRTVDIPASKLHHNVLSVLEAEGYINGFERVEEEGAHPFLRVTIKYFGEDPAIKKIQRISRPGRRVYTRKKSLPRFYNGYGVMILSTSQGVMTDYDALKQNLGGEVLCQVF